MGRKAVFALLGVAGRMVRTPSGNDRREKDVPTVAESQTSTETDWVSRFADDVIAESERRAPGKPVVVASGLSPSGPIHLGNLREVMTPHLVADEIRRRGHTVRHLISWDDYDRFRKVPNGVPGVDTSWAEHIGKPLTSVPAPAKLRVPELGRALQGCHDGGPGRAGRRVRRHQPDGAVHRRDLPRADPARDEAPRRHRRRPGPLPDEEGPGGSPGQGRQEAAAAEEGRRGRAGGRRGLRRRRRGRRQRQHHAATSRTSPTAATARRTSPSSPPTTTTRPS